MPKVLNRYKDLVHPEAVYIGRPSKWGNPFVIGPDGTREDVILKYKVLLKKRHDLVRDAKKELRGKDLVCSCAPNACHGDVLLEIANSKEEK